MDGIIVINKPKNCTSHDVVRKAKKALKTYYNKPIQKFKQQSD